MVEILPYGLHLSEVKSFAKIIKDVDGYATVRPTCADPDSFVRGGPTKTVFSFACLFIMTRGRIQILIYSQP